MIKVNVLSEENSWSKKLNEKEKFFNKVCKFFPEKFKFANKKVYLTFYVQDLIFIGIEILNYCPK